MNGVDETQADEYNIAAVRGLLTDAFAPRDLWRFCQDRTDFRPVLVQLGYNPTLADMVDAVLVHCQTKLLFGELLAAVKSENPRQYERYADQLRRPAGSARPAGPAGRPRHSNLPARPYARFVGRGDELKQIHQRLRPHPQSTHHTIIVDGIGGIGKSALALEAAYFYADHYADLPPQERFEAIIWASAKRSILTADGVMARRQALRTLDDVYATIAAALDREDITRARAEEQPALVERALGRQRTLLILDNYEAVDDEQILAFIYDVPDPTKVIVTSRQRIDGAYPIRLSGLSLEEALTLVAGECRDKPVTLTAAQAEKLAERSGGVPLAIVWSIALMGYGHQPEAVLQRLDQADSDIARFCFAAAVDHIRGTAAYQLLLALSLFVPDAGRAALGHVAGLAEDKRDTGLVELGGLSLVNKRGDRFSFLPLTRTFAAAELSRDAGLAQAMGRRWVDYLKELGQSANRPYYWLYGGQALHDEGPNFMEAIRWSRAHGTADDVFVLTKAAYEYLEATGQWQEGFRLCEQALSLARSIQDPLVVGHWASLCGWILLQWGDYEGARSRLLEAVDYYRRAHNREGEAIALQQMCAVYRKLGDLDQARAACDQAWSIAQELEADDLKALINTAYGKLARTDGQWELAWTYFSRVQSWFAGLAEEAPRDEALAGSIGGHLAIVAYHLGRPQEARELCLTSLGFFEARGTKGYRATLKYRLALAEEALGETAAARRDAEDAADWFDRLGMKPDLAEAEALLRRLPPHPGE